MMLCFEPSTATSETTQDSGGNTAGLSTEANTEQISHGKEKNAANF